MTISQTTRTQTAHADRAVNLAGTVTARVPVPDGSISARVVVRKSASGSWGGAVPVGSDLGAFLEAVTIADPGADTLVAHAALGVDQLDGIGEIVVGNGSSLAGTITVEVVFTLPD